MYTCSFCNNKFESVQLIINHIKIIHGVSSRIFKCKDCGKKFYSIYIFKKHLTNQHPITSIDFLSKDNTISNISEILKKHNNTEANIVESQINEPISTYSSNLPDAILKFSLALHNQINFNRQDVIFIQNLLNETIFQEFADSIKDMQDEQDHLILRKKITELESTIRNPFSKIKTEHLFIKHIIDLGIFRAPIMFSINKQYTEVTSGGTSTIKEENTTGIIMPIHYQLEKFLEQNGIYELIINNIKNLSTSCKIANFIHGNLWQKKIAQSSGKNILPLFLYFDEFGVNNPLGPHSTSICGIYYSIPVLPDFLLSSLSCIFLAGIIKAADLTQFGNNSTFHELIKKLIDLEQNGITLNINSKSVNVYFTLCLVVGDNLALNGILGYSKSFNCKHYCRICTDPIEVLQSKCVEDTSSLRTIQNYNNAFKIDDLKNRIYSTGIKENSAFNRILGFHVTQNFSVDIMHDLLEGVCHYDLCKILNNFIFDSKFFSIEILNYRKQMFPYGEREIKYRGNPIKLSELKNNHFRMTAREMLTFTLLLPLMIQDLVPRADKVWKFLLCLIDILDIVLMPTISEIDITILKSLIRLHNEQYQEIFNEHLKPKYHFLIHYPTIIRNSGPLKHLWSMRFEAKHKIFKNFANNTSSRKNLPLTLSIKYSMQFSHFVLENNLLKNKIFYFNSEKASQSLLNNKKYYNYLKANELQHVTSSLLFQDECIFKGTCYKKSYYIPHRIKNIFGFFEIVECILFEERIFLTLQCVKMKKYDNHFRSYIIEKTINEFYVLNIDSISEQPTTSFLLVDGKRVLRYRKN